MNIFVALQRVPAQAVFFPIEDGTPYILHLLRREQSYNIHKYLEIWSDSKLHIQSYSHTPNEAHDV